MSYTSRHSSPLPTAAASDYLSNIRSYDVFGGFGAQISQIANEDVVMQSVAIPDETIVVIPDTNILIHKFEVLEGFVAVVEEHSLSVKVVIPGIVIQELDGHKKNERLQWFARRASLWILNRLKERKSVKGQALQETIRPSGSWKLKSSLEDNNLSQDDLIIDCGHFYQRRYPTIIVSNDHNLYNIARSEELHAITNPKSSRALASQIFANWGDTDLAIFPDVRQRYTEKSQVVVDSAVTQLQPPEDTDNDRMDVDDDNNPPEPVLDTELLSRQDARDLLHAQVVNHFTRLLVEIVGRNGGSDLQKEKKPTAVSKHAPNWQRTSIPYRDWDAALLLEFLSDRRRMEGTTPRLDAFLSKPYTRGARRGQEWSVRDWLVALRALAKLGEIWTEPSVAESLGVLKPHVEVVFDQEMKIFE